VTDDSAFKKQVRARMTETGENYTTARRMIIARRNPGQPPVALRVYLNQHVDLELTGDMARAYAAADEQGQRDMANRLLADQIEAAGSGESQVAVGSRVVTDQAVRRHALAGESVLVVTSATARLVSPAAHRAAQVPSGATRPAGGALSAAGPA
jgi:hypothetical protein